jgi:tetratricopeptide (TPR) repeat protein
MNRWASAHTMNAETIQNLHREGKHEEARALAVELVANTPGDAELQYEAACVHDYLGREAEAIPFYTSALAGSLEQESLRGAFLGLGSTYRTLGRYGEAKATLLEGLARFPEAGEIKVFLAMALHNLGESKRAIESLLLLLAETSNHEAIQAYREAIRLYAKDIDKTWP